MSGASVDEWWFLGHIDLFGDIRGKLVPAAAHGPGDRVRFSDALVAWTDEDLVVPGLELTGWHAGFPDLEAVLDDACFPVSMGTRQVQLVIMNLLGRHAMVCSRTLLADAVADLRRAGLVISVGAELEFRVHTAQGDAAPDRIQGYALSRVLARGRFIDTVLDRLPAAGVDIWSCHPESGPGAFEIALAPTDPAVLADRIVVARLLLRQIAEEMDLRVDFAPVCHDGFTQGLHLHVSVVTDGGGEAASKAARGSFLAGVLAGMAEMLPMYTGTPAGLARFRERSWAPTTVSWGVDNRSCAVREVQAPQTRLEIRVPASGANPHLALAAVCASGALGARRAGVPPPPIVGEAYASELGERLPTDATDAVNRFTTGEVSRALFPQEFLDHFGGLYRAASNHLPDRRET